MVRSRVRRFFRTSAQPLGLPLVVLMLAVAPDPPKEIRVCPTCPINRLQTAVAAVAAHGTVILGAGLYSEGQIKIEKPLHLRGEPGAIIDGNRQVTPLLIAKTDHVTIENLQIQNSGMSYTEELAAIRIADSADCRIIGNHLLHNTYGIYLENSRGCRIEKNQIASNAKDEVSSGNGIHLWTGEQHEIIDNEISGHRDGIYLEFAKQNSIRGNLVKRNIRYGLHFMSSHETRYEGNTFTENGAGVAVMYSRKIAMIRNHFVGNTGAAAYGLLLKDIVESQIEDNRIEGNTTGIYMEGSNRSEYTRNEINDNGWGLRIMGDCEQNTFHHNNFIGNSFDVGTNANHSWNEFRQNYWSQYDGFDLDGDGLGDKPFRPVSLSSLILERVDSSFVLLNSFFFHLIDEVERVLPEMIPEPLKDESPLIKRVDHD